MNEAAQDPDAVYRGFLRADVRPLIQSATVAQLRAIVTQICARLCRQLRAEHSTVPGLADDRRRPWQSCEVGNGMRAGFQLYQSVIQSMVGSYLAALGFDPACVLDDADYPDTVVRPAVSAAAKARLRRMLHDLVDHIQHVTEESDASASLASATETPDDLWEVSTGVTTGMSLYNHVAITEAGQILLCVWEGLSAGQVNGLMPFNAVTDLLHPN